MNDIIKAIKTLEEYEAKTGYTSKYLKDYREQKEWIKMMEDYEKRTGHTPYFLLTYRLGLAWEEFKQELWIVLQNTMNEIKPYLEKLRLIKRG